MLDCSAGGDGCHVCDAAEVEQHAALLYVAEQRVIEHGNERCALTSGGEVGGAEIADDGDAEALCDDAGFACLPGGTRGAAREGGRGGLVIDGLTVAGDEVEFCVELRDRLFDAVGIDFAEAPVKAAHFSDGDRLCVHRAHDCEADCFLVGEACVAEELDAG